MEQRSNVAAVKDALNKLKKEEYASSTGQVAEDAEDAVGKDALMELSKEECA